MSDISSKLSKHKLLDLFSDSSKSEESIEGKWRAWFDAYMDDLEAPLRLGDTPDAAVLLARVESDISVYQARQEQMIAAMDDRSNLRDDLQRISQQDVAFLTALIKGFADATGDDKPAVMAVKVADAYLCYGVLAYDMAIGMDAVGGSVRARDMISAATQILMSSTGEMLCFGKPRRAELQEDFLQKIEDAFAAPEEKELVSKGYWQGVDLKNRALFKKFSPIHESNWNGIYEGYLRLLSEEISFNTVEDKDIFCVSIEEAMQGHYEFVSSQLSDIQKEINRSAEDPEFFDLMKEAMTEDLKRSNEAYGVFKAASFDEKQASHDYQVDGAYAYYCMFAHQAFLLLRPAAQTSDEDFSNAFDAAKLVRSTFLEAIEAARDQFVTQGEVDIDALLESFKIDMGYVFSQGVKEVGVDGNGNKPALLKLDPK